MTKAREYSKNETYLKENVVEHKAASIFKNQIIIRKLKVTKKQC